MENHSFIMKPVAEERGIRMAFYYGDDTPCFHEEMNLVIENEDRSYHEEISDWLPATWEETAEGFRCHGSHRAEDIVTTLRITVEYTLVDGGLVKKEITLAQENIPVLFYTLETKLRPGAGFKKHWSFDNTEHRGGIVHGTYPALGFETEKGVFGLLTDAGHRNLWTRNIRRRAYAHGNGFQAILRTCDAKMLEISKEDITLRLGCLSDYVHCEKEEMAPLDKGAWQPLETSGSVSFQGDTILATGENQAGLFIPYPGKDGFYTLRFAYRATSPLGVKVLKETPESEIRALHYQDNYPADPNGELTFESTFFLSDTEDLPTLIKVFQEGGGTLALRDIHLVYHHGTDLPYHPLRIGHPHKKTLFYFGDNPAAGATLRNVRLLSQTRLADGLGFSGSDPEKVLFADAMMLCWITSEYDFAPLNVPSINYAPDMYNRDSFWTVTALYDRELSEGIFDRWGDTQIPEGGIGTIVTPCIGSDEVKGNEATCEWLWWALINKERYGSVLPMEKLTRAFAYCVAEFDPRHTGVCESHFILGQNDVTTYPGDLKTSDICVNQGMWAATLKVARALGLPVDEEWIARGVAEYRGFYDPERGYMLNDRKYPGAIACNDLLPEFVSLWLFREPMLSDEMVVGTLEKIPRTGDFGHIIGHAKNIYFTMDDKPYDGHFTWPNGIYYNGGSWMREEVMGYATGVLHGWDKGLERIERRLQAEIDIKPDEPFSHEFIPTDLTVSGAWWPGTRVFSWNAFALIAKEVALRGV